MTLAHEIRSICLGFKWLSIVCVTKRIIDNKQKSNCAFKLKIHPVSVTMVLNAFFVAVAPVESFLVVSLWNAVVGTQYTHTHTLWGDGELCILCECSAKEMSHTLSMRKIAQNENQWYWLHDKRFTWFTVQCSAESNAELRFLHLIFGAKLTQIEFSLECIKFLVQSNVITYIYLVQMHWTTIVRRRHIRLLHTHMHMRSHIGKKMAWNDENLIESGWYTPNNKSDFVEVHQ